MLVSVCECVVGVVVSVVVSVVIVRRHRALAGSSVRLIYAEGGPLGFYRGNMTNVLKIMPESAFKFYANDYAKSLIVQDADSVRPHAHVVHTPRTCLHDLEGGHVALPPDGPAEHAPEVVVVHDHMHARVEEQADELQALRVLQPEPSHQEHLGVERCRLGDVTRSYTRPLLPAPQPLIGR